MLRAYKYRLYPNKKQSELIDKHIGACRFLYNLALETKQMSYNGSKRYMNFFALANQLPELKNELVWLKEINSQSLQMSLRNLETSFTNFFKETAEFPKFKSKNRSTQSFQVPQHSKIDFAEEKIYFPKFKEGLKIAVDRKFKGDIKTITISKAPTKKYFVSVLVDNKKELPSKKKIKESTAIGIDLGIKSLIVTSDGLEIDNPKYLKQSISRLKYLSRQVSKKVKGSSQRKKAVLRLAKCHEQIKNKRKNFLQKLSSDLIKNHDTICIENLAVANMVKNHCLAQSISDSGWTMFVQMLKYKADWYGKNILQIGRWEASTKTCCNCGTQNHDLTLIDREWTCANCGTLHNRDICAAVNIKNFALLSMERTLKNLTELPTLAGALKLETLPLAVG
jgi:putative transposase